MSLETDPPSEPTRLPRALRPMRSGQYRLLAAVLSLGLASTGMWVVTVAWQVIAVGGGPAVLSLVATANGVGLAGAAVFGGVAADRVSRQRILVSVQLAKAVAVASVAAASAVGAVSPAHLVIVAAVLGIADAFFYPAYSAIVPSIVGPDELLAANGIEGVLRPTLLHAAGPAIAGAVLGSFAPGLAFAVAAGALLASSLSAAVLRPIGHEASSATSHPARSTLHDLREGFSYLATTRWLATTLVFSVALVMMIAGPLQVLLPFVIRDGDVGGPGALALALACLGLGSVVGSLGVSSLPLPRRYLSTMILGWGIGCVPLAALGLTSVLWIMCAALFSVGVLTSGAAVIWGTLLQRRVPRTMLGRVSSLDFFVSLSAAPVSAALVTPAVAAIGQQAVFVVSGVTPVLFAVLAVALGRLPRDEAAHPLHT